MANKRMMMSCNFTSNNSNQTCEEPSEEIRGKALGLCEKHWNCICIRHYQPMSPNDIYLSFRGYDAVCYYNQPTCVLDNLIDVGNKKYVCLLCYNRHYKGEPSIETLKNYDIRTDQIRAELYIEEQNDRE